MHTVLALGWSTCDDTKAFNLAYLVVGYIPYPFDPFFIPFAFLWKEVTFTHTG